VKEERNVRCAHRRLAIVDRRLSPAGDQPMISPSGRYVIVYNGELYNHLDLRRELDAAGTRVDWRGHSDTETLLAAIEAWGVGGALERSIGMFAFALWDRQERQLILARDRLGEKPLYYGWQGEGEQAVFLFGSELKALAAHPAFRGEIDRDALALHMRHNCMPAPYSIYRASRSCMPGTFLATRPGQREPEPVIRLLVRRRRARRRGDRIRQLSPRRVSTSWRSCC
jgi:asparagine synthase (glutamine-hydrolysing)